MPDLLDDPDLNEANDEINLAKHIYIAFVKSNMGNGDPKMSKEGMVSPQWPEWKKVIKTKLDMLN